MTTVEGTKSTILAEEKKRAKAIQTRIRRYEKKRKEYKEKLAHEYAVMVGKELYTLLGFETVAAWAASIGMSKQHVYRMARIGASDLFTSDDFSLGIDSMSEALAVEKKLMELDNLKPGQARPIVREVLDRRDDDGKRLVGGSLKTALKKAFELATTSGLTNMEKLDKRIEDALSDAKYHTEQSEAHAKKAEEAYKLADSLTLQKKTAGKS